MAAIWLSTAPDEPSALSWASMSSPGALPIEMVSSTPLSASWPTASALAWSWATLSCARSTIIETSPIDSDSPVMPSIALVLA